jgi:hypothetical protein
MQLDIHSQLQPGVLSHHNERQRAVRPAARWYNKGQLGSNIRKDGEDNRQNVNSLEYGVLRGAQ